MPPVRPASLKVRALQWLSQREHSRSELHDKLLRLLARSRRETVTPCDVETDVDACAPRPRAFRPTTGAAAPIATIEIDPETEVNTLLEWLEERGYLSDARFAESKVQSRQSRYGNQRIRQELRQRGVTLDEATEADLASSEVTRACAVWRRKYDAPATDAAGRLRQMRFLVGRGFSLAVVQRVLRQAGRTDEQTEADVAD